MERTSLPELEYKSLGSESLRDVVAAFLMERAEEGGVQVGGGDGDAERGDIDGNGVQSNNVVAGGDTTKATNGGFGKCPFFKGSLQEVVEEELGEQEEQEKEAEAEAARVAAAAAAGIEAWPTAGAGVAAASTPPSSWYYDGAAVPDLEAERVFARGWQAVGRADQVSVPGSYFTGQVGKVKYVVGLCK